MDEDGLMVEVEVEMNRTELELLLEIEELIEDGIEVDLDERNPIPLLLITFDITAR